MNNSVIWGEMLTNGGSIMRRKEKVKARQRSGVILILLLIMLVAVLLLVGCNRGNTKAAGGGAYKKYVASLGPDESPVPSDCFEQAIKEGELITYNWADWWPESLFTAFTTEFGIKVTHSYFADMNEMVTKLKLYPKAEYDWAHPDLRGFLQLKEMKGLQKLNHKWLPNVEKYLPTATKNASYDPGWQYGVPSDRDITTYIYNKDHVDDPRMPSWAVLFEPDAKYKGRVTLNNDMFECIGGALKYLGYSWNSTKESELAQAKMLIQKAKPNIMGFESNPMKPLYEDEVWIAQNWFGSGCRRHAYKESLWPVLPKEGTQIMCDLMTIPIGAAHPAVAHLFINYIFRPKKMVELLNETRFLPNHTVAATMLPKELLDIYPPQEYLDKNTEYITSDAYTGKGLQLRSAIWEELKR